MKCGECKHWTRGVCLWGDTVSDHLGGCERWLTGYHINPADIPDDGCLVEDDEGWAMLTGRNFGCVLFEAREAQE